MKTSLKLKNTEQEIINSWLDKHLNSREFKEKEFKKVFEILYPPLCLYANKFICNMPLSEDIVQDFFSELWNTRKAIDIKISFKSFAYTCIKNKCVNHIKKQQTEKRRFNEYISFKSDTIDGYNIIRAESIAKLGTIVNKLPNKYKKVILLSMSGLTNREIQDDTGIHIDSIKYYKKEAYKLIRKQFKKD